MNEHVKYVLLAWLALNGYRSRQEEFEQLTFSHPDFPSVKSVVDTLAELKIEYLPIKIPKESFRELDTNTLIYISDGKHEQLAVYRGWDNGSIILLVDKNLTINLSESDFLRSWNGMVVAVDTYEAAGNGINLKKLASKAEFTVGLFFVVGIISLVAGTKVELYTMLSFTLSMFGLIACTQIVKHELGIQSGVLDKVCTLTTNSSCDAVLSSPAAKLFGLLGMGDLGFTYFTTLAITIFFMPRSSTQILPLVTTIIAPFTLFSVWYQWRVVKKWCPLCLSVVVVLLLMLANTLIFKINSILLTPDVNDAFKFFAAGIVLMCAYLTLKPLLGLRKVVKEYSLNLLRFKRDYHLFLPFFISQKEVDIGEKEGDICIGDPNAPLEILAITNPMCSTCFDVHKMYESILEQYPSEVKLRIRFYVPFENREDLRTKVAERLIELYESSSGTIFKESLNDWYRMLGEGWLQRWKECGSSQVNRTLEKHKVWCESNGIYSTPAIFINGRLFPTIYGPLDLKYMIKEIIHYESL